MRVKIGLRLGVTKLRHPFVRYSSVFIEIKSRIFKAQLFNPLKIAFVLGVLLHSPAIKIEARIERILNEINLYNLRYIISHYT